MNYIVDQSKEVYERFRSRYEFTQLRTNGPFDLYPKKEYFANAHIREVNPNIGLFELSSYTRRFDALGLIA